MPFSGNDPGCMHIVTDRDGGLLAYIRTHAQFRRLWETLDAEPQPLNVRALNWGGER